MNHETDTAPSPDDLKGWKAADSSLAGRFSSRIGAAGLMTPEATKRYFGSRRGKYLLGKYGDALGTQAFMEWLAQDYRPFYRERPLRRRGKRPHKSCGKSRVRHGKTLAERMLGEEELPCAERMVLENRLKAHPTFFRTVHVEAGSSIAVEDILLGDHLVLHDRMLSTCAGEEDCLAGRAYEAGEYHFFSPIGPPFPLPWATEALEVLERNGVELTREGLIRDADKFGRLRDWLDKRYEQPRTPHLCNTDGDELVWHTASFSVSEEEAVRDALLGRDDVDYDRGEDQYVWSREQRQAPTIPGDTVTLGRLGFVMGELILEVNSAERLLAARAWLERIPGVIYQNVKTRRLDDKSSEIPMDDRADPGEQVELTPELASHVREMFHTHYMKWLDTPLPMLEGKTPRQTCRTEQGRRRVAMTIRAIPKAVGNPAVDVDVPREEMLRALGIESM